MTKIIHRNSRIPCRQTQIFTTFADNQPAVSVQVFEGERALTRDNNLLGTFDLTGIPLSPRGVPKIDVTFDIDADGILNVSANETSSGNSKNIRIRNENGRLSQKDIVRMLVEAQSYRQEDERQKGRIKAKHNLEGYIYELKRTISDCGKKLSIEDRVRVHMECENSLNWLDGNSLAEKEDYMEKQKELLCKCGPIVAKLCDECEGLVTEVEEDGAETEGYGRSYN
ncbi:hypothetical protein NQ318_022367 [Aromia moschata]|uniref:Heat shock protein 70 n=1 Tax=Aromia moschata TaxID=1265417 RepID=A0AAV8Z4M6_9CUCU|nr:hypothetical protein NQ318_022367 [Aromia moschata]